MMYWTEGSRTSGCLGSLRWKRWPVEAEHHLADSVRFFHERPLNFDRQIVEREFCGVRPRSEHAIGAACESTRQHLERGVRLI